VLARGKLAAPGENGGRLHEATALPTLVWRQQLAGRGQAPALVGSEDELLVAHHDVELLSENAALFLHVVELALQPIVDRGGDHRDDERQRHRQHLGQIARVR
jgi:hypothetical protein